MKAHIAAIAIIMLLGIAIAGFLFMVREKAQTRADEIVKENFEDEARAEIEDSLKRTCELEKYELIIDCPAKIQISGKENYLCIDSICKELKLPENCTIENFNYTL